MRTIQGVLAMRQRDDILYIFRLKADEMLELCKVERFGADAEGVNRMYDEGHALEIAEAMLDQTIVWGEPILGDLRGKWTFDEAKGILVGNGDSYVSVDDGQHRLGALQVLNPAERVRLEFTVTATMGLSYERRLKIFRMQNERKPIDARLDLAQRDRLDDWKNALDREAYQIVKDLNSSVSSPLKGKILLGEQVKRPYEARHRPAGINGKGLNVTLRRVIGSRSPLHVLSPQKRLEVITTTIRLASDVWASQWNSDRHILTTARGINAVLMLFMTSPAFNRIIGEDFSQESLRRGLEAASTFDWSVTKNRYDSISKIGERLDQSITRNRAKVLMGRENQDELVSV